MAQLTIHFDPDLEKNQTFFNIFRVKKESLLLDKLPNSGSKEKTRIKDTSKALPRVDPNWVAEQLGAEIVGHLNLIDSINFEDLTITLESGVSLQIEFDKLVVSKDTRNIQFKYTEILKISIKKPKK